jgi:hypothetical protein
MRERWESLDTRTQVYIAFPVLWIAMFLLNLGPFAQPLGSCIIYAFIEGGFFTWLLVYATKVEKARRGK